MNIIINGAGGRMGQVLCKLIEARDDMNITAKISTEYDTNSSGNIYGTIEDYKGAADMIIDFSNHAATSSLCQYAQERNLPLIIATTGQTQEEMDEIISASKNIPVFKSGNMSLGIALLGKLAKQVTMAFPSANIEIIEKHHNQKLDVPSGTALMLADGIKTIKTDATYNVGRHENGMRTDDEIGIHSIRMGSEVGTHEVIFATNSQVITLAHKAENRGLFADGALTAAEFLMGKKPGIYDMNDIVEEGIN